MPAKKQDVAPEEMAPQAEEMVTPEDASPQTDSENENLVPRAPEKLKSYRKI